MGMGRSESPNGYTWYHRGYQCLLKQRERRIRCIYQIKRCNLWMPREFYWENTSKADCNHYIDLLARKQLADAQTFDEKKIATEHIYERGDSTTRPFVNVNAQRLIALLRGEEVLEVPIDARIRVVPPRGRYSANDVDAEIFSKELTDEYFRRLKQLVGEGRPIVCVTTPNENDLIAKYGMRLVDAKMHSGMNLDVATEGLSADDVTVAAAPSPAEETLIASKEHRTHTETITLITGSDKRPYFVRRLIRGPHLLWCGTSYSAEGPWTEYHRDQSRLVALNITTA